MFCRVFLPSNCSHPAFAHRRPPKQVSERFLRVAWVPTQRLDDVREWVPSVTLATLVDEEDRAAEVGKRAGGIVDGQEDAAVAGDDDAGLGLSDGRAQDQA